MTSRKLILSTALLLLSGCGSEDSPSQASNYILAPLAGDAFEVLSKDDKQTTVSLKDVVIDPQGLPLTLESVIATEQNCAAPTAIDVEALTFTVDNTEPELCFYRYSIKNHPAQASQSKVSEANSYVLKSASTSSLLAPMSETTQVGTPITITIEVAEGYTLDSEVVVLGDGGAVVDANTITYTPNAQGVTRLVYTVTSDDDTDMMTGTIDVAVSDVGNTAPSVTPVELSTQPDDAGYYNINQSYTIDLGRDGYVSDADGDAVQLIQVKAWNATVALAAPDEPTNLSFTFQTSTPGAHYVTYVVSDHRGGYGVEQVRIEAYDLDSVATWAAIQQGAKLYSAPLTQSEALISEAPFTSSHVDSNGATVATFSFEQAQSLCESKGALPTSANLTELSGFDGGPSTKGWPVDVAFWANDEGTPALINLATGATETESASGHYVTCINEGGFTVDTAASDFEAVADGSDPATVVVKLTYNDEPVQGEVITASSDSADVTFDSASVTTGEAGEAAFVLRSLKAGDVTVSVEYSGETLTQPVSFVGDETTAGLTLETTTNNADYSDASGNAVEVTMLDANSNPLAGRAVTFDSEDSVTITSVTEATDASGKQSASVVWSGDTSLMANSEVNVTARFTPSSTGTEVNNSAVVTFINSSMPTICGGAVDDADPTNATGNCLKVATDSTGNWFTSTPSLAVMEALEYDADPSSTNSGDTYAAIYTSEEDRDPVGGEFALFTQQGTKNNGDPVIEPGSGDDANAGVEGQFDRWCQKLNALEFGGKANWRRPTDSELADLWWEHSSEDTGLWSELGWPTAYPYLTSTIEGSNYMFQRLETGGGLPVESSFQGGASCISPPPLPMCGTGVDDTDPTNATGNCLKVATDAAGNWFTSTPSIAVMEALGYSADPDSTNTGDTYADTYIESGDNGPVDGEFARFTQDGIDDDGVQVVEPGDGDDANAGVEGQFDRWCQKLNALEFGGKTTWRRPIVTELSGLYDVNGNMWSARGWPTGNFYWSSTVDGSDYNHVRLVNGYVGSLIPSYERNASCVSEHP